MIIHDPHIERIAATPSKHHSPLIVDPYRVKSLQVAFQSLESIAGRRPEIPQVGGFMEKLQLASRGSAQIRRERPRRSAVSVLEQVLGERIPEGFDHIPMLSEYGNIVQSVSRGWRLRGDPVSLSRAVVRLGDVDDHLHHHHGHEELAVVVGGRVREPGEEVFLDAAEGMAQEDQPHRGVTILVARVVGVGCWFRARTRAAWLCAMVRGRASPALAKRTSSSP